MENNFAIPNGSTMEPTNRLTIRGAIVSLRATRRTVSILVATDAGGAKAGTNFPLITFFDTHACDGFTPGTRVTVEAHMRTAARRSDTGDTQFFRQIVGDSIKPAGRILAAYAAEEEANNGGMPDDMNEGLVAGEIVHVYQSSQNVTVLTFRIPEGRGYDRVNVTCFRRQAHQARQLKDGDFAVAAVSIRTLDAEKVQTPDYQTLICKDIVTAPAGE